MKLSACKVFGKLLAYSFPYFLLYDLLLSLTKCIQHFKKLTLRLKVMEKFNETELENTCVKVSVPDIVSWLKVLFYFAKYLAEMVKKRHHVINKTDFM